MCGMLLTMILLRIALAWGYVPTGLLSCSGHLHREFLSCNAAIPRRFFEGFQSFVTAVLD